MTKPTWDNLSNPINKSLNDGERWFVTLYNQFEFPNGKGDYNNALSGSSTLTPYNTGYSGSNDSGNYIDPLAYKGVYEIIGIDDTYGDYVYIATNREFKEYRNIGGDGAQQTLITPFNSLNGGFISGSSLGMLIWKARATGKNEFVIVQDQVTGGVGEGAFINRNTTQDIRDNFEEITKTYGKNK